MVKRSPRGGALAALLAGLLVGAFFCSLLAYDPLLCWKDDMVISIMPVFDDVARAWTHGEWPLLSPFSWACGNLAGEYQYGTFSPAVNLAVVAVHFLPASLPAKAALLSLSQLILLAMGAALLGSRRGAGTAGGVLVGIVAALNGWNIAWGATDWFGALAANAWLPWCWWAFERALEEPAEAESALAWWWRRVFAPGACVYLLVSAGFPYTVGMLGLVSAWLALRTWFERGDRSVLGRVLALWPLAAGWLAGLGLAAPAWLSLLEYIPGSDRARGVNVVPIAWSVPWKALPALILPAWRAAWPDFAGLPVRRYGIEVAGGLVPLALLAAAFTRGGWRAARSCGWELGLTGMVLLLCMLPSPGIFRWSFRWLPLFALALSLAAVRSGRLAEPDGEPEPGAVAGHNPGLWAAVLVMAAWLAVYLEPDVPPRAGWLPALTLLAVLGWAAGERLLASAARHWLPAAVALLSLWLVYRTIPANKGGANTAWPAPLPEPGVPVYAIGQNILSPAPLSTDRLYLCLSLEPYLRYRDWQTGPNFGALVRPGSTSMFAGVHLVNGYSPVMAAAIGRRLEMETHGNVPERAGATLLAAGSDGDALLERIGVDGLIVSFDYPLRAAPPEAEWDLVYTSPEGKVYHRRGGLLPAVWADAGLASISRVVESRNAVSAQVNVPPGGKPALIRFRRPFFPGYRAWLDGRAIAAGSDEGYLPTVELPPGSHGRLELRYLPRAVVFGGIAAGLSVLVLAASAVRALRR